MMVSNERTTGGRVVVRGLEYEVPYGRAKTRNNANSPDRRGKKKKKRTIRWLNKSNRASRYSCSRDNNQTWEERTSVRLGNTSEGNW